MQIVSTRSPIDILRFLEEYSYKGLPVQLWDQYLWMYSRLLGPLSAAVSGYELGGSCMYLLKNKSCVEGVVFADSREDSYGLFIDVIGEDLIELVMDFVKSQNLIVSSVSLKDAQLAQYFADKYPEYEMVRAQNKYSTVSIPSSDYDRDSIRELSQNDEWLFDEKEFSGDIRGWLGFAECISKGIRYFGYFRDNRCVSVAGLTRLTKFRSEVIAVHTFCEKDRRRGYATAVCLAALVEGLQDSAICTWTTNIENLGGNALARKLGFTLFSSDFLFRLQKNKK